MKGLELSLRMIVVVAVMLLLLITFTFFFTSQSAGQFSQAEANSVFFSKCEAYKGRSCDWRVTYERDFSEFYSACKQLNSPDIGKFTCLYKLCCATSEDVRCDGLCELCAGRERIGITLEQCCEQYFSSCSGSPSRCGVCGE